MKSQPVVPARIEFGEVPFAPEFSDLYHPRIGAREQARHVFLAGNGLPGRWAGRGRFTVLETGFGLGNNFIATWQAWREDAARCRRLEFVSIEKHPPRREDLERAHRGMGAAAGELVAAWPPLVPGLHRIEFDAGAVVLLLAFGDVADWLPELVVRADAIYLDGFAPAKNPQMWTPQVLKAVGRRAAPGATAATWSVARELRAGLTTAGFAVERAPGIGGKREITVARFAPRHVLPAAPAARRSAFVVGAGLAGAAVAEALALEGLDVTVLDRAPQPAAETSGQLAGLFHGTLHADDGPHARLLRAAALWARRAIAPQLALGLPGRADGLLRLAARDAGSDAAGLGAMQALIERQDLPADWVEALACDAASERAGVPLPGSAWSFAGGGWTSPPALVARWLAHPAIRFVGRAEVARLDAAGARWRALGPDGRLLAEADAAVVANAHAAWPLLAPFGWTAPLERSRGQTSGWRGAAPALNLPVAGDGYAIALPPALGGGLLCGATDEAGDDDAALRESDHEANFERLRRLTGLAPPVDRIQWQGRVGWRVRVADRLPIAGAVPAIKAPFQAEQARRWPRIDGLFVITALGGRGITLAPLLGRLVAAQVVGGALPLEQSLVDAIDPVRWRVRAARRGTQSAED